MMPTCTTTVSLHQSYLQWKEYAGEQIFWSNDGNPFIMVVSNNCNESHWSPLDFVAFYFDGSKGASFYAGTCRNAGLPVADKCDLVREE